MQTGWDQQTVNETEDARTHCARRHDPLATRMDSMLHRWPNVAKDGGEDQTEKARRNRHKTFTAEEAQEVRKFDTCPTVVHGATHQPVMIPASTPMLISGLMVTIAFVRMK